MTANAPAHTPFPVRGTPGGWRDWWDDPDDTAALRALGETAEARQAAFAASEGPRWQAEARQERKRRERERQRRRSAGTVVAPSAG